MSLNGSIKFEDAAGKVRTVSTKYPLPTAGGGGGSGASDGLTNAQLRAAPVPMIPVLTSSKFYELDVTQGQGDITMGTGACKQVSIANVTPGILWAYRSTAPTLRFPIFSHGYYTFFGITDVSQIRLMATEAGSVHAVIEA